MHDLPDGLRRQLEAELERVPVSRLVAEVDRLVPAYRSGEAPVIDSVDVALAYAAYRMPGTYAAVRTVMDRLRLHVPDWAPISVLDVGGGTGAAVWAAVDAYPGVESVTVLDSSAVAIALGETLAAVGPPPLSEATWTVRGTDSPLPAADLTIASYLLGELAADRQARLVEEIAHSATTVAVVEPGTTAGYRRIIAARERLIEAGLAIAAPCPHETTCPLVDEDDWCHFAARFTRSSLLRRAKRAKHGYEDEKFSYVVASRTPVRRAPGRIIRHPQTRSGLVMLEVCQADGRAETHTISKRRGPTYRTARHSNWGDPWAKE